MPPSGAASGSAFRARSEPPGRSGASASSQASASTMSATSAAMASARRLRTPEFPPRPALLQLHAHVQLRRAAELRLQLVDRLLYRRRIRTLEADQLAAALARGRLAGAHLGERQRLALAALRAGNLDVHAKRSA